MEARPKRAHELTPLPSEDITEEVEIFQSADGNCYVDTIDGIPKTIENCNLKPGTTVTIMYGHGLPWAKIVTPGE